MTLWQSHPTLYFEYVYIWNHLYMVPGYHIHNLREKSTENHNSTKSVSERPLSRKWQDHSWEQTFIPMLSKIKQAQTEINAGFIHFNVPKSHPENLMIIERHLKFLLSDRFTVICPCNIFCNTCHPGYWSGFLPSSKLCMGSMTWSFTGSW